MTAGKRAKVEAEIQVDVNHAHIEAHRILETTVERPDAIDPAIRALCALVRATALRGVLEELDDWTAVKKEG